MSDRVEPVRQVVTSEHIDELLARSPQQRRMEYKYRCAQAIVFGVPVLGLQWFGAGLGGTPEESQRWLAVLQALLTGWVTYVGAAGMLVEGIITLRQRVTMDFLVAAVAVGMYLFSVISAAGVFVVGRPLYRPLMFHVVVVLLAGWCGYRWWRLRPV